MKVGEVLEGRWELVRRIGAGGMGSVWEARELASGRRVAIKALHPHLVEERDLVDRFLREARAALEARWSGHIIEVIDVVRPEGEPPYQVIEYLDGEDLERILAREHRLDPRRAVDLVIQTCHALEEVHRQGLIHRDIKPENIFVIRLEGGAEWIKLLDFGVVKFSEASSQRVRQLTEMGRTVGTPQYMAPEQATVGATVDHRIDVYALGVVLYELLTGDVPFEADDVQVMMHLVVKGRPRPPRKLRPELAPALERVVLKAMARDSKGRFETMFEFAEALEPFSSGGAVPITGESTGRLRSPRRTLPDGAAALTETFRWRSYWWVAVVAAVILGLGVLALHLVFDIGGPGEPGAVSTADAAFPRLDAALAAADSTPTGGEAGAAPDAGEAAGVDGGGPDSGGGDRRQWVDQWGDRLDRRRVDRALTRIGPGVRACLRRARPPGSRVRVHFWITSDGEVWFRRIGGALPPATRRCLEMAARAGSMGRTGVPPFVATRVYRVPN